MDTPICVIDAKTLVDYIQDIKRWIYNGQLRLVVPSSTLEHVEQIYQKSIEIEPTPKETPRLRSSGKPAKKEFPAFDINPRLARTFLTRLKTWKEEDVASEQRAFLLEKENHEAVEFQQPAEQYTPWKDSEIEEEKPEPILDRPATWAEALRRKQAVANGTSEDDQLTKGPVKPKLVAKTPGSDSSPWKIKKDAPKLSAKDVPGILRPLLSCALWHLHESIHRNDPNQLFLLCNQPEIGAVAQKLNITVRSVEEIRHLMATKSDKTGLKSFGDLEREFGVQLKSAKSPATGHTLRGVEEITFRYDGDDVMNHEEKMNDSISSGKTLETDDSRLTHEERDATLVTQDKENASKNPGEEAPQPVFGNGNEKMQPEEVLDKSSVTLVEASIPEKSAWTTRPVLPIKKTYIDDIEKRLEAAHLFNDTTSTGTSRTSSRSAVEFNTQKAQDFIPKSTSPAISASHTEPAAPIANDATPSSNVTNTQLTSNQATPEPEDSDEEEIVFKPQVKRYSAQRKPVPPNSRPSTPKTQPLKKPEDTSPQVSTLKPQPQPQPQPKPVNHGRNPMVVGHGHPRPTSSPTVIDPNAFGRNFAINTNPSPRAPHNTRSHHHPRSNAQNGQCPQAPRSPRHQNARTCPPRQPHESSQRLSPAPEPTAEQAPRTSPRRRSRVIDMENAAPRNVESSTPAKGVERQPTLPVSKQFGTDEFVSRSSSSNVSLSDIRPTPSMNRSREYQTADFVPRSQMTQTPPNSTAPGPQVFEPSDFVPRSALPTPLYKPRAPEPDYIEPRVSMQDVEYVLKSGSTRASARGRGRLWTPS